MATPRAVKRPPKRKPTERQDLLLTVEGYKAVRSETQIRIAPLTLIAGSNSAGKSSFMQPFLMMKQTLDSAFDPGALLLYGPNVRVTDRTQIMSRGKSRTDVTRRFKAGMALSGHARTVTFGVSQQELVIESDEIVTPKESVVLSERLTKRQEDEFRERFADRIARYVKIFGESDPALHVESAGFEVYRNRCFLDLLMQIKRGDRVLGFSVSDEISDDERWVELLRGIIHVPGLRGNPERSYSRSAVGATYPGTFETYVASIVYAWTLKGDPRLTQLSAQLEELGLTWKLMAKRLNDASIELLVGRTPHAQQGGANDVVSVADVGFGVSQTLPVLVALLAARRGQVVYLEQPEIHLHPRAQLALAGVLVTAAKRGVRVVAETHSSLVIRGIQTAVANGELPSADLSFNWFGRDQETGFQSVTTAEVDGAGRFGDWPLDFDDVSRDADWAYLDAVEDQA